MAFIFKVILATCIVIADRWLVLASDDNAPAVSHQRTSVEQVFSIGQDDPQPESWSINVGELTEKELFMGGNTSEAGPSQAFLHSKGSAELGQLDGDTQGSVQLLGKQEQSSETASRLGVRRLRPRKPRRSAFEGLADLQFPPSLDGVEVPPENDRTPPVFVDCPEPTARRLQEYIDGYNPRRYQRAAQASGYRMQQVAGRQVRNPRGVSTSEATVNQRTPVAAPKKDAVMIITTDTDSGKPGAVVYYNVPTAVDMEEKRRIDGVLAPGVMASGGFFPIGIHNIAVTATDNSENVAVCRFQIEVKDTEPPVFVKCPVDREVVLEGSQVLAQYELPEAMDNSKKLTVKRLSGPARGDPIETSGNNPVIYEAEDAAGNIQRCEFVLKFQKRVFREEQGDSGNSTMRLTDRTSSIRAPPRDGGPRQSSLSSTTNSLLNFRNDDPIGDIGALGQRLGFNSSLRTTRDAGVPGTNLGLSTFDQGPIETPRDPASHNLLENIEILDTLTDGRNDVQGRTGVQNRERRKRKSDSPTPVVAGSENDLMSTLATTELQHQVQMENMKEDNRRSVGPLLSSNKVFNGIDGRESGTEKNGGGLIGDILSPKSAEVGYGGQPDIDLGVPGTSTTSAGTCSDLRCRLQRSANELVQTATALSAATAAGATGAPGAAPMGYENGGVPQTGYVNNAGMPNDPPRYNVGAPNNYANKPEYNTSGAPQQNTPLYNTEAAQYNPPPQYNASQHNGGSLPNTALTPQQTAEARLVAAQAARNAALGLPQQTGGQPPSQYPQPAARGYQQGPPNQIAISPPANSSNGFTSTVNSFMALMNHAMTLASQTSRRLGVAEESPQAELHQTYFRNQMNTPCVGAECPRYLQQYPDYSENYQVNGNYQQVPHYTNAYPTQNVNMPDQALKELPPAAATGARDWSSAAAAIVSPYFVPWVNLFMDLVPANGQNGIGNNVPMQNPQIYQHDVANHTPPPHNYEHSPELQQELRQQLLEQKVKEEQRLQLEELRSQVMQEQKSRTSYTDQATRQTNSTVPRPKPAASAASLLRAAPNPTDLNGKQELKGLSTGNIARPPSAKFEDKIDHIPLTGEISIPRNATDETSPQQVVEPQPLSGATPSHDVYAQYLHHLQSFHEKAADDSAVNEKKAGSSTNSPLELHLKQAGQRSTEDPDIYQIMNINKADAQHGLLVRNPPSSVQDIGPLAQRAIQQLRSVPPPKIPPPQNTSLRFAEPLETPELNVTAPEIILPNNASRVAKLARFEKLMREIRAKNDATDGTPQGMTMMDPATAVEASEALQGMAISQDNLVFEGNQDSAQNEGSMHKDFGNRMDMRGTPNSLRSTATQANDILPIDSPENVRASESVRQSSAESAVQRAKMLLDSHDTSKVPEVSTSTREKLVPSVVNPTLPTGVTRRQEQSTDYKQREPRRRDRVIEIAKTAFSDIMTDQPYSSGSDQIYNGGNSTIQTGTRMERWNDLPIDESLKHVVPFMKDVVGAVRHFSKTAHNISQ